MDFLRTSRGKLILEFLMCAVGAVIAAFAIEEFLAPNTIDRKSVV